VTTTDRFTRSLWARIEDTTWPRILAHPWMDGLTSGSLPEERFRHYVVQDSLYLREFGPALAVLAARSRDEDSMLMFCRHAQNTVLVERALHAAFISRWSLDPLEVRRTPRSQNCLLYTSWITAVANTRPYWEGIGAVLACYWIYWEVGKELVKRGSPHPIYQQWISTYAGEEFANDVRELLQKVDELAPTLTEAQREALALNWETGVKMELMFWEMGWTGQGPL
jgi:thiaminase/transcriptional activator TenA